MDESGSPLPDWIGLIRAARNSQEQNLEAVSDLPGGQVRHMTSKETYREWHLHYFIEGRLQSYNATTNINLILFFFSPHKRFSIEW